MIFDFAGRIPPTDVMAPIPFTYFIEYKKRHETRIPPRFAGFLLPVALQVNPLQPAILVGKSGGISRWLPSNLLEAPVTYR